MTSVAVVAVTVWLLSVFVSLFLCYLCYRNLTPILYTSFHFSGCFPYEPGLAICFLDFSSVCFERVLFGIGTWNTLFYRLDALPVCLCVSILSYLCYRNLAPILYASFYFSGCFPVEPGLAICFLDLSSVCSERVLFGIGTWNTFFYRLDALPVTQPIGSATSSIHWRHAGWSTPFALCECKMVGICS